VSEFSKQEIVETFSASPDQIQVIYPGIDHDRYYRRDGADVQRVLERFQIPKPFFLYIGRIEWKKNVGVIIRAFEQVVIEAFEKFKDRRGVGDPFRLVLVGQPGAGYEEVERLIAKSSVREMIHVVGYVNEEEKIALLSSAAGLIHPAWYEGFGIPIVEAMATGCPVICSKVASLPEVAGEDHVLWFDPTNVYDLVKQMATVLHPDSEQEKRAAAAMEWSRRYTWEQAAQQTFTALTEWS
jgi:alpha-1,3-rhamnosyl/mannosyltransferase